MTVEVISTVSELRRLLDQARLSGQQVGFVPTMGSLHAGHVSLMQAARGNGVVVASVFVNPLQFAAGEDFDTYPRDVDADCAIAADAGVDLVFAPDVAEMYPSPMATVVSVPALASRWEGEIRPGHLDGMAAVVTKLLSIVGPCRAYFGEKDFQQLQIVRRLVRDLALPVDVIGCPTVRESDGLALSSRNARLDVAERSAALVLRAALDEGIDMVVDGQRDPTPISERMGEVIAAEPLADLDYAVVVRADDLMVPARLAGPVRLLVAARFGSTRLIDNDGLLLADDESG